MPSDKEQRKQVIVDRDLLAQLRKYGRKFRLNDGRDAALVEAVLREWISTQSRSVTRSTSARVSETAESGREYRLNLLIRHLRTNRNPDGTVGPIGHKALAKEVSSEAPGGRLSPTFVRKALEELVSRGELLVVAEYAGSVGAVYRIPK